MTGDERWPLDPYRPNPDAPYQQGDVIESIFGTVPQRWEILFVGKYNYFVEDLMAPRYRVTEATWTKWSCHDVTRLVSRVDTPSTQVYDSSNT